jgi:F-type H+-transporting ATPase subunit c
MRRLFFVLLAIVALTMLTTPVFAQEAPAQAARTTNWVAITSGFAMAIAVALAALGQSRVASSACEGLARNPAARPGIQLALILGLAFIESLVLFTLVIVFVKVV